MSGTVIAHRAAGTATPGGQRQVDTPCPACGAAAGRPCTRRGDTSLTRDWPHEHRNHPPIVLIDIDGVLADLQPFAGELDPANGRSTFERWQRFFDKAAQAPLIESGADLVHALRGAGVRLEYSMTRPPWTIKAAQAWLAKQGLPAATVHARGSQRKSKPAKYPVFDSALVVKQAHCHTIDDRHGLAAFIDDEPAMISGLRAQGHHAVHPADLADATMNELRGLQLHRQLLPAE